MMSTLTQIFSFITNFPFFVFISPQRVRGDQALGAEKCRNINLADIMKLNLAITTESLVLLPSMFVVIFHIFGIF